MITQLCYVIKWRINKMACEKYTNCEYCRKDYHCPYDHMGDVSPWCGEFQCTVDNCKRYECISYEEELFEMRGY